MPEEEIEGSLELLMWFGLLGVRLENGEELYAHSVQFNLRRLTHPLDSGRGVLTVHRAFQKALAIGDG